MFCQNTSLWLLKTDCDWHRYIQMAFQTQLIEELKTDFSALISTIFFNFPHHWTSSLQMVCLYNTFQFILIEICNSKRSEIAVTRWLNFQNFENSKQTRVWIKIILIVSSFSLVNSFFLISRISRKKCFNRSEALVLLMLVNSSVLQYRSLYHAWTEGDEQHSQFLWQSSSRPAFSRTLQSPRRLRLQYYFFSY